MNVLIEARNKRIDQINRQTIQENEAIVSQSIFRTILIDRFGTWNCDRPFPDEGIWLTPRFVDAQEKEISPAYVSVVTEGFNGIFSYPQEKIKVKPGTRNMILGAINNQLVYLAKNDYLHAKITPETKAYTFRMQVHEINEKKDISERYKEIKEMMDLDK